ncbi:MAG TPA: DUF3828 domain-containing protein [Ktedonobacterales bacterium]|nr:DUF3828 domain-containing protein [Ktedonobacterales bacterium]
MSTPGHAGGQLPPATHAEHSHPQPRGERRRGSHRGVWITLGSIIGMLAVAAGLLAYFVVIPILQTDAEVSAASVAARNFCADLTSKNYSAAYDLLSTNYQKTVSSGDFTSANTLRDTLSGAVQSCPIPTGGPNVSAGVNTVTLLVSFTRPDPTPTTTSGSITLIKQGGQWKLDKIDDALLGKNVAPLMVAVTFCDALVTQDYATAYKQLSSRYQQQGDEGAFQAGFTNALSALGPNAKIATCAPDFASYKIAESSGAGTPTVAPPSGVPPNGATVNVAVDFAVNGTALGQPITLALTLIQENGAWKIDNQQTVPTA